MAVKVEFEIYLRRRKRYVRGSDGFTERKNVIFAGFLEAGRLVKAPGALRYVKLFPEMEAAELFVCTVGRVMDDQLISLRERPFWNKDCYFSYRSLPCFYLTLNSD